MLPCVYPLSAHLPLSLGQLWGTSVDPRVTHEEFEVQRQFIQIVNNKKLICMSPNTVLCLHSIKRMDGPMTKWKKREVDGVDTNFKR